MRGVERYVKRTFEIPITGDLLKISHHWGSISDMIGKDFWENMRKI